MDWESAKRSTIEQWGRVRRAVDREDGLELLIGINAICDLCVAAKEKASPGAPSHCPHCPAYQQFGGCREAGLEMSIMVSEKDWDGLRGAIDDLVARLEAMEAEPAPVDSGSQEH